MNRKCLCFISGLSGVGMLAISGLKASDGAEVDYGREWNPYVTLRGGWLFGGKVKTNERLIGVGNWDKKQSIKSAWSGSAELGTSYDDRVFVGLELGYFTGKAKFERGYDPMPRAVVGAGDPLIPGGGTIDFTKLFVDGKMENFFGACNVTLRHDIGERAFLYGGIGAGVARSRCSVDCAASMLCTPTMGVAFTHRDGGFFEKSKWRFLGQAFAGFGVYLNDNWQLMAGYRLRWVPGSFEWKYKFPSGQTWSFKTKQDIVHAAEIGLTYQF